MLKKNIWIPLLSVLVIAMGCGLFYGQKVANQEPVKVYKPVEIEQTPTPKPPPPGETAESGHWKPGDEWHSQPHDTHAPAQPQQGEVSEVEAERPTPPTERTQVPGAPVGAQSVNAQSDVLEEEAYKSTQKERDFQRALKEWGDRLSELSEESSRAGRTHTALSPGTEEELERYKTDPEWQRKLNEALAETAKVSAMVDAHMKEMPIRP